MKRSLCSSDSGSCKSFCLAKKSASAWSGDKVKIFSSACLLLKREVSFEGGGNLLNADAGGTDLSIVDVYVFKQLVRLV